MSGAPLAAQTVIAQLGLAPHPEGGWFAETFRDGEDANGGDPVGRAASTAIYYLLEAGQTSAWHRVTDAAEVWHHYAGAPLRLSLKPSLDGPVQDHVLGSDLAAGQRPQAVCPRGVWQSAASLGAWTLCGCTVAPGFEFASFELAPPE
ncbi:MAG TPA: cupin domain-containing protein [Caulobacteraceae bacterium]|nr:cupin domain-containing protein [Caulobacteraceae bacterium]